MIEYLTLEDVARSLKVSKRTVQRRVSEGRLRPAFYIGRFPRFTDKEVAAYAAYLASTSHAA